MPLIHDRHSRGRTRTGWLESFHTFSFGGFNDPGRMGFRALRVLNEDRVMPGAGFGRHDHADVDILTYAVSGALRHEDSLGNGSLIRPNEIQLMSAGTGVTHAETNASSTEPVHFLQIWLIPDARGGAPTYAQGAIDAGAVHNQLHLVAGPAAEGALTLRSDNRLYLARLDDGATVTHPFAPGRAGFLQVVWGTVMVEDERLMQGDGLQFEAEEACTMQAGSDASEVMLFDLA